MSEFLNQVESDLDKIVFDVSEIKTIGAVRRQVTRKGQEWTAREYDDLGRELLYENNKGYWSKHHYSVTERGSLTHYESCKGKSRTTFTDLQGSLVWMEEGSVRWWVLVERYPRLYACRETGCLRIGDIVGSKEELQAHFALKQKDIPHDIREMLKRSDFDTKDRQLKKRQVSKKTNLFKRVYNFLRRK